MKLDTLRELYIHELHDIFSAEHQMVKALPKMIKKATHPKLKKAFEDHLKVTEKQINRLEEVFRQMGEKPKKHTCKAMQGLIAEGEELMKQKADHEVMDAGLIMASQKLEHYEIASYGTAIAYAKLIGEKNAAQNLQLTIDEEGKTDKDLTNLAMTIINIEAIAPEGDDKGGKSLVGKAIDAITGGGSKKSSAKKSTPGAKSAAKSNGSSKASMNGSSKSSGTSSTSKTAGKGKK